MAINTSASPAETYVLAYPTQPEPPALYISYGLPFTESCARHVSQTFHAQRVYIMASTSLSQQTNHVADLERALGQHHVGTWTGVRPHTYWDDIIPIINDMREKKADLLITIGGCSLVDGAKVIIYALANNVSSLSDLEHLLSLTPADSSSTYKYFRDKTHLGAPPTIPIICLPTTLSASEYTRFGGGTSTTTHEKVIMTHPRMYPSLVILAPELAVTTPMKIWLSTGVRAIDHCVESFCSVDCPAPMATTAATALGNLVGGLLTTKRHPKDPAARVQCHLAAKDAAMALLYMPDRLLVGASHGIGHQLGPLGVGHGETSCILLPAVCKYNYSANSAQQDELKRVIWNIDSRLRNTLLEAGLSEEGNDLGDVLDVVFRELEMPRSLKEVGVGRDKFAVLAENSLKDPCSVANPRPLTMVREVEEILEMVVG